MRFYNKQEFMRKIKYSLMLLPVMVLLTLAFCFRQNVHNNEDLSQAIVDVLENNHYEPKKIDDNFSSKLFNLYLKNLDQEKRFFLQSDIDSLKSFQNDLDDEALKGSYEYFDRVNGMYVARVSRVEGWYKEFLSKPFDFTSKEYLDFDSDKPQYLMSEADLKEFWRKSLKQQTLEKLARKMDVQEKALAKKDTMIKEKTYEQMESESRNEVLKTHNDWFSRIKKFDRRDKLSLYMNCIAEMFDPHTSYLPPADKENFDIRMSGQLKGIGATLEEKDGYVKVASIIPGSPSYKQGQLKAGDIILKVAQGNSDPVDITNMKMDDAIKLIRGEKGTTVKLTVKKPDESIVIIPIVRDIVVIEETYAKSSIVELKGKKYGYINLPSFYVDMNDKHGRSCSKDVAKEIEKLKKDKVKGIVLDLRNNGGGSLGDVIDMAGLFIEDGPVTLVKSNDNKIDYLGDDNKDVLWNGPLTIMVNENSASASEILAAAMQDYKRAAIIGTPTYGKGTVQRIFDLNDNFGSVKITIQKFYRINGTTTQLMGVTPDIIIPDRYRYLELGEKENEFALSSDKINAAPYKITLDFSHDIKEAKEESDKRIAASTLFNEIDVLAKKIKAQTTKTHFTLNLEEYRAEMAQMEADNKRYSEITKQIEPYKFYNTSEDDKQLKGDDTKIRMKQDWNKSFEKDAYIQEAVNVLKDLD